LSQFDEISENFSNLSMFCILSINFATDLRLTLSLSSFVDNSKIYKRCERVKDQIWTVKWIKSVLKLTYKIWTTLWAEIFNWGLSQWDPDGAILNLVFKIFKLIMESPL